MFGDKFGNLGKLAGLMKNAGKIQEMMEQKKAELAKIEVTGEAGAGLVKVTVNAENYAKKIEIDDSLLSEDKSVLQDLIAGAINDATHKTQKIKEEMMMDNDLLSGIMGNETEK